MEKNNDIDFAILNQKRYEKYKGINLSTCFLVHESEKGHMKDWTCITRNDDFFRVNIIAGMVSMMRGETEYDITGPATNILNPVLGLQNKEDLEKCKFSDIKKFMKWRINKDNYIE
tara:strand:+ start:1991 stop:2338 length:348 start_codon:yes stop_codon:yes gene_type:complete